METIKNMKNKLIIVGGYCVSGKSVFSKMSYIILQKNLL